MEKQRKTRKLEKLKPKKINRHGPKGTQDFRDKQFIKKIIHKWSLDKFNTRMSGCLFEKLFNTISKTQEQTDSTNPTNSEEKAEEKTEENINSDTVSVLDSIADTSSPKNQEFYT